MRLHSPGHTQCCSDNNELRRRLRRARQILDRTMQRIVCDAGLPRQMLHEAQHAKPKDAGAASRWPSHTQDLKRNLVLWWHAPASTGRLSAKQLGMIQPSTLAEDWAAELSVEVWGSSCSCVSNDEMCVAADVRGMSNARSTHAEAPGSKPQLCNN